MYENSERHDSVTATASIEERLLRLETAHTNKYPKDSNSPLVPNASLNHQRQISELGELYNELEEAIHTLEQAHNSRVYSIAKLEQDLDAIVESKAKSIKSAMDDANERISKLEHSTHPDNLSSFSSDDIAQELVRRLGNGDTLGPVINLQLQVSVGGPVKQHVTPEPVTRSETASSKNVMANPGPQDRQSPVSALKRALNGAEEDEPPVKRRRGRPRKNSSARSSLSNSSAEQVPKKPRGRPPKHGRYSRKSSSESIASQGTPSIRKSSSAAPSVNHTSSLTPNARHTKSASPSVKHGDLATPSSNGYNLPPERQSARKRTQPEKYGGPLPWKEVWNQVKAMKPSAPGSGGQNPQV